METSMGLTSTFALVAGLVLLGLVLYQSRQLAVLTARLAEAVRSDPLTGLLNRRSFEGVLEAELERSAETGRPLSVIVADVDGLPAARAGGRQRDVDAVLELVADDLRKWKRRIDSAGRIGREEFALLLPETDESGALLVAERLRRAAHRTFDEQSLPVTICFGVAGYPDHRDRRELLLSAAARALGAAREPGPDGLGAGGAGGAGPPPSTLLEAG
jgi:diguanylate cyclase (GGDEF)-like protein